MNKYQVELTAIVEAGSADEAIAKLLDDPKKYFASEIVLNHEYTV